MIKSVSFTFWLLENMHSRKSNYHVLITQSNQCSFHFFADTPNPDFDIDGASEAGQDTEDLLNVMIHPPPCDYTSGRVLSYNLRWKPIQQSGNLAKHCI